VLDFAGGTITPSWYGSSTRRFFGKKATVGGVKIASVSGFELWQISTWVRELGLGKNPSE
jgi:hypothetical protein